MSYVIATSPRSGSFLLCEGLTRSGIAGVPQEYSELDDRKSWKDYHHFHSHVEYFFRFRDICTSSNGVTGVKLMWPQFTSFLCDARRYLRTQSSPPLILAGMLGTQRVVRLRRRDRRRQAISWVRARQTGIWSRRKGEALSASRARYDFGALQEALTRLAAQDAEWDEFLAGAGFPVLNIDYEDLADDFAGGVGRVLAFLDLPPDAAPLAPPALLRQADVETDRWLARASADPGAQKLKHWSSDNSTPIRR